MQGAVTLSGGAVYDVWVTADYQFTEFYAGAHLCLDRDSAIP